MNKAEYYKKTYPVGTRIRLLHMDDPYSPIPDGMTGSVAYVDDMGTLHMKWDNGRDKNAVSALIIKEVDIMRGFIAGIVFTLIVEGAAITVIVGDKIKEMLSDEENG